MADANPAIIGSLNTQIPVADPFGTLEKAQQLQYMGALTRNAQTQGQTAQIQGAVALQRMRALQTFGPAAMQGDPDALSNLAGSGAPDAAADIAKAHEAAATASQTLQKTQQDALAFKADRIGNSLGSVMGIKDESQRPAVWNSELDDLLDQGVITPQEHARMYGQYSPLNAQRLAIGVQKVQDQPWYKGQTAEATAKGELPTKTTEIAPGATVVPTSSIVAPDGAPGASPAPSVASAATGNAPTAYAARVAQLESGNNPTATNPASTAAGPAQFIDSTWLAQAKKDLPAAMTQGKTDAQVLAMRTDPNISAQVANGYAADNAHALQGAGINTVGPAELYMAHQFGPDGAANILKAPMNAPISSVVGADVMKANPQLIGKSVKDVYADAQTKMAGIQAPGTEQAAAGAMSSLKTSAAPGGGTALTNPNTPALVNLNTGGAGPYVDKMAGGAADFVLEKQKDIPGTQAELFNIADLRGALRGLPTGPGETTTDLATLNKFATRFGLDTNQWMPEGFQTDPTKVSIAQKNMMQLASAWAKANFPTRITNVDMNIAMQAVPNFENDEKANDHVLDNLEQVARMKLEEAKFYRDFARSTPKGQAPDVGDMIDAWTTHVAGMKDIDPKLKQSYLSYSDLEANPQVNSKADQPGALPTGAIRSVIDPADKRLKFQFPDGHWEAQVAK